MKVNRLILWAIAISSLTSGCSCFSFKELLKGSVVMTKYVDALSDLPAHFIDIIDKEEAIKTYKQHFKIQGNNIAEKKWGGLYGGLTKLFIALCALLIIVLILVIVWLILKKMYRSLMKEHRKSKQRINDDDLHLIDIENIHM